MRGNEELMRNLKINDNSGHLVPCRAPKPLGPIPLMLMGSRGESLVCADPGARIPIGVTEGESKLSALPLGVAGRT